MRSKFSKYEESGHALLNRLVAGLTDDYSKPWDTFPCLTWPRGRDGKGYGRLWRDGKIRLVPREAYELVHGPIPEGMCALHHCDNPPCFRPVHLFMGSKADNQYDRYRKGRFAKGEDQAQSKLTEADVQDIFRQYSEGGLKRQMGRRFGVSASTIDSILKGKLWGHIKPAATGSGDSLRPEQRLLARARGERVNTAKLTERDVRRIRTLRAQGTPLKLISVEFDVSLTLISMIARRKTWKHIP